MDAIMCGGNPTAGDRALVDQFAAALARTADMSEREQIADGDLHLVAPDIVDRNEILIRKFPDGTIAWAIR